MQKLLKKLFFSDYTITLLSSVLSLLLGLVLSGVFARILSNEDFLDYNLMVRYFGFFQAVLSGAIGFGIIHFIKKTKENIIHRIIVTFSSFYFVSYVVLLMVTMLLFSRNGLVFNVFRWDIFLIGSLWFLGESFKHKFSFLFRGIGRFQLANVYMLGVNVGVVGVSLALTLLFDLTYYAYQFWVGVLAMVLSLIILPFLKEIKWEKPFLDSKLLAPILKFSFSRWLENIFRMLFVVVLVSYLAYMGYQEMAGYIAVLFTLLKLAESGLQAFNTVIFSKSAYMGQKQLKRQFLLQTLLTFLFSAVLMGIFWISGDLVVQFWLGKKYIFLSPHFRQISFALFPVIGVFLYKGVFENFFAHSPLMILNFIMILSIAILPFLGELDLEKLLQFIVIVFWVRFFIYLAIAFRKLNSLSSIELNKNTEP